MYLAHLIQLHKARHCRIILSGLEVILVQDVGRDQLLAAEPVGLAGCRGAEVGDHAAVGARGIGVDVDLCVGILVKGDSGGGDED